ncbi:hypothetical protein B0H10DRAFT_1817572 [Mycena sp. CBHHK59/15]|nr:hypothetical protein B0H10DRAFT_1817572 [Mycena sp. CBHHK59/15]
MCAAKKTDGSDLFIIYDNGYYYLTMTTWSSIQITHNCAVHPLASLACMQWYLLSFQMINDTQACLVGHHDDPLLLQDVGT